MESSDYVRVRVAVVAAFMIGVPLVALTDIRLRSPWETAEPSTKSDLTRQSRPAPPLTMKDEVSNRAEYPRRPSRRPPDTTPGAAGPAELNAQGSNRIDEIQAELKKFGAIYLLLDAAKGSQRRYRYCCDIPSNSPRKVLRFEAFDADPLAAMEQVLEQVRAYNGGSHSLDASKPGL